MDDAPPPRARLARLLLTPGETFDLAEAALLVAAAEYPRLPVSAYLHRLEALARAARPHVESAAASGCWSDGLSRFLFDELGFRGSTDDYDDPRNSYLNEVLDRRRGLPILLSALYLEIAWRCGRPAVGVGLPGHFIVRVWERDGPLLLDPFHRGARLTEAACRERVAALYGSALPWQPEYLAAAGKREILARILRNLKQAYLRRGDTARALRAVEMLLLATPDAWHERRDQALLRLRLGDRRGALAALDAGLEHAAEGDAAAALRQLRSQLAHLWERRN